MKRLVALVVLLPLLLSSQVAWGAKKKGPKPYKSDEVTIAVAHPVFYTTTQSVNSVTAKEFENSCAVPSSNGLDAAVYEVPKEYQNITFQISAIGTSAGAAGYDLDVFMYDANCAVTFASQATGTDENGVAAKGTAWLVVGNYLGDPETSVHIELAPYKL